MSDKPAWKYLLSMPVIVAAVGYFVDIYDLILFTVVRVPSLKGLGISDPDGKIGAHLLDLQMYGMLAGGILWGVMGDKRGRVSVLFGSIILYSLANLLNAGVGQSEMLNGVLSPLVQYQILRVIAGLGLAGELGAGITLVSESLPTRLRGLGTMIVATVGVAGALFAFVIAERMDWRAAYLVGGGMGFALLLLRIYAHESGLFSKPPQIGQVARGDFLSLFTDRSRLRRYLVCIGIGAPTWFVVAIFIARSKEMGEALGISAPVKPGQAVFWCYAGLVVGDLFSGLLSQVLRSRRKAILVFLMLSAGLWTAYLSMRGQTPDYFYAVCFGLGIGVGYWALFVTVAAEQFGTNLRATVATTVPNMVRGLVPVFNALFFAAQPALGAIAGAAVIGGAAMAVALVSLLYLRETFAADLDYQE